MNLGEGNTKRVQLPDFCVFLLAFTLLPSLTAEFDVYKTNTTILKDLVGAKVRWYERWGGGAAVDIMPLHCLILCMWSLQLFWCALSI